MTRPASLPPTAVLAERHPHGDRIRYRGGCRCAECRSANNEYEKQRARARKAGEWNGLVPIERARAHLAALSKQGVGRRQIRDAAGVTESVLDKIANGRREHIRAMTERAILAVTAGAAADGALVDAGASWTLIDQLLAQGYSKAQLARELGHERPALQLSRSQCTVRNAHDVAQLHRRLLRVPARRFERVMALLREEGYRPARIEAMVRELAQRLGQDAPDLQVYDGFVSARAEELLERVYAEVVEEPA